MNTPLASTEIQHNLLHLPGWYYQADCLEKTYCFQNFREAISFIVRMSFCAEELQHHPEIHHVYNQVKLRLTTHDAGNQVTQKDIDLARSIESFSWC